MKQFAVRFVFVASLATLTAFAPSVFAEECPVEFGSVVGVEYAELAADNVGKAESCYKATKVAEACAMGSSIDVPIAAAATGVCEKDFKQKLTPADAKTYKSLIQKCVKKYANMQGTMYQAAEAFCVLDVAKLYSQLYTPAE